MKLFFRKVYVVFLARLREFYRDKSVLYWNLFFPFFILLSFYFIFKSETRSYYKVGIVKEAAQEEIKGETLEGLGAFSQLKYIQFLEQEKAEGLRKIKNHKLDMLIDIGQPLKYWVPSEGKGGYFLEKILKHSAVRGTIEKQKIPGRPVPYVVWLFPGVLALNIMFSCLWGVGWVIVKYRDEGYLKRLNVTPIKVHHFILGQMGARFVIVFFLTSVVYLFGSRMIGFEMRGSYLDLAICYLLGTLSLISIGLLAAVRTTSKEFADGLLNVISWPMIIFSGMWFSLEGSSPLVQKIAAAMPLTHLIQSTRKIMLEGAHLKELSSHLLYMGLFSAILFAVISLCFKWNEK